MILKEVCLNNNEAADFLVRWCNYVHLVDDLVDEKMTDEKKIAAFAMAIEIYTHPFFLKNLLALRQVAVNATNMYADSVALEKSEEKWAKDFADWARHSPTEMALAVAFIVGGYAHMRTVSLHYRKMCYGEHHDETGKAF